MAHSKSAEKRIRQNERRRLRNRTVRSETRTLIKKFEEAVGNRSSEAQSLLKTCVKKLDQAVSKGVYHRNTVARKKSSLQRKLNALKT